MKQHKTNAPEHGITPPTKRWLGYTVAVVGTAIDVLVRWALLQAVGHLPLYLIFYPTVFAAAIVGGTGPGLLATFLSVLAAALFFIEPIGKLEPGTTVDAVGLGLFLAINVIVSILGGRLRMKSEALRESEARLLLAHQTAHIGAFEWNVKSDVNIWTQALEAMYGLKPGEFDGTQSAWEQLIHPEDRPKALAGVERALKTFQPQEGEWRVVWPDGSVHWLIGRFQAFKDYAGKPSRLVGANVDITERKRAEGELRQSEERFRTMANAIPQLAWIARPDGYVIWYNRRWYEYTGATPEQLEGWGWQRVHHPEVLPRVLEKRQRTIATGQPFEMELPLRGADGRFRPFLGRIVPLKDQEGKVALWFGTYTDITELWEREQKLGRQARLIDLAPAATLVRRPDGIITFWSRGAERLYGWTKEEALGRRTNDLLRTEFPEPLENIVARLQGGGTWSGELRHYTRDGRQVVVESYWLAELNANGQVEELLESNTDITERKRAEAALQQSEARYRTLVERAPLPVGISRNGFVVYLNPKFLELYGCQSAEAQAGRPVTEFWAPESRAIIEERVRRRPAPSFPVAANYEGVAQRDDGSRFPVQVASTMVELPDGPATLAFLTDITELKQAQAELKRHQEHLEELVAERTAKLHEALAELEHMSYSMVHDMRAPLRAMQSFASMMQEECAGCRQPPALDYLQRIRDSSNRLDRLLTDALNYNKVVRENLPMTPVPLAELLRGMVKSYPNLHPPAADITLDLDDLVVLGNESLLTQCFGNLLDNAVKFVAPGVHPRVRLWAEPSTSGSGAQRRPDSSGNSHPSTLIYIQDNGIGIPRDAQEKLFRMFQRMHTESEYPGTGIGLAIVRKAVERMNGRLYLDSEPGKGSRFCVELPQPVQAQNQQLLQPAA